MSAQTHSEIRSVKYSVEIERDQLTYIIEKGGNTIRVNANPLYEFLKEMFTTDWQDQAAALNQQDTNKEGLQK